MEHTQARRVDTGKLLHHDSGFAPLLANLAGVTLPAWPAPTRDLLACLPDSFGLAELAAAADPTVHLTLVDSLVGDANVRTAGRLLVDMAYSIYLPRLPAEHPGRVATLQLLDKLAAWLDFDRPGSAEAYIAEAFRYRSAYGTTITSLGTDPTYQWLFEAMPSNGLDCVLGQGMWHLDGSWRSFCRHEASTEGDWQMLDDMTEVLKELTEDGADGGFWREVVLSEVFDPQREVMTGAAGDACYEELAKLMWAYFPELSGG